MYKMVVTPNQDLLKKSDPVIHFDKKLKEQIKNMRKTLDATRDPVGVGLAAPQVGISKRIFLAKPKDGEKADVYINPEIVEESAEEKVPDFTNSKKVEAKKPKKSKKRLLEGCLSVPNIWGNVARKKDITLSWQDEDGEKHQEKFTGFAAIIIQHEIDHLDGVLFTKHVLAQGEQLYRSYKNEDGEEEFEELEV